MDINIRSADRNDFGEIRRITVAAYSDAGYIDDEYAYNHILAAIEEGYSGSSLLVAESAGRIVGSVFVTRAGGDFSDVAHDGELEFRMLAVEPGEQHKGIAHGLVAAVIERARIDPDVSAVVLTIAPNMDGQHKLYESMDFVRVPARNFLLSDTFALHVYKLTL
ncbi:GNAT family N-acetyltransferase [Arthrobacter tumbae]|uniref:GNAT family N-acetyltransferase n=1 Tax=Arthrobacter tumbae TaxID=163874 RepID=UPI0019571863|nr:GNAT family N-acetyltransferase [Arthrobacter tumbae]MBM7782632.1 putative N-acetyltransferase YhbS [Arthrobacter tumbae]